MHFFFFGNSKRKRNCGIIDESSNSASQVTKTGNLSSSKFSSLCESDSDESDINSSNLSPRGPKPLAGISEPDECDSCDLSNGHEMHKSTTSLTSSASIVTTTHNKLVTSSSVPFEFKNDNRTMEVQGRVESDVSIESASTKSLSIISGHGKHRTSKSRDHCTVDEYTSDCLQEDDEWRLKLINSYYDEDYSSYNSINAPTSTESDFAGKKMRTVNMLCNHRDMIDDGQPYHRPHDLLVRSILCA